MDEQTFCTSCLTPVRWVLTTGGRRMPLDPAPHPEGNVVPVWLDEGGKRVLRARVLTGVELPAQEKAWRAHFVTCPNSDEHRRRRGLKRRTCPGPTADGDDCRLPMDPWLVEHGHRWHITCGPAWPGEIRSRLRRDAA